MKKLKKCMGLMTALVLCLSLVACGGSGKKWSDANEIDAYSTLERSGEQVEVCVCHDRKTVYIYRNDENHELLDTAKLPTGEFYDYDKDWLLGNVDFSDFTGDSNSDLQVYISHSDMSESYIVWTWEEGEGYVYQPDDSRFYRSIVVRDPPEDSIGSEFSGIWYLDEDLSSEAYIVIDGDGNWSFYRRAPGDAEGTETDCGTFSCSTEDPYIYYADSALYDDVRYLVLDFDEGILVWGDEGTYYRTENLEE